MELLKNYLESNKERFLDELFELIRIPSVSSDPAHQQDMHTTANKVKEHLIKAGVDQAVVYETDGHPVVYGEKMIDTDLPTVMVYGHYDVQPADPLELWDTDPFDPVIKKTAIHPDGAIFARGSCDDKGQFFMHVKAFEAMVAEKVLPCNVKFMIEGEEEIGSPSLAKFCEQNKELLASDVILVSDTSIIANDSPSITTGLRGLSYVEVEVVGPNKDLHSGVYGGGVANPANVLTNMISQLMDENKRITIEGFYDDVVEVSPEERVAMNKAPFNLDEYKAALDIDEVEGEKGYTTLERTSIRPTLDINGIWSGFTGEGTKTVLPAKAHAKISMRLVPNQDPKKIAELFEKHFKAIAPPSVKVNVKYLHGGFSSVTPVDTPEYKAAAMAMEKSFGKEVIPVRSGGSIPIIALFEKVLGVKSVLIGFGLDSDAIHSPNEHYGLFNFYKGIETIPYYYQYYKELKS
jgi:acetylornithine deacetylase/succinyl-diaminopimelate desuccinylase-like protein